MSIHHTKIYGGPGGRPYKLENDSSTVKTLEVFTGWGTADCDTRWILKGIKTEWYDGTKDEVYNNRNDFDMCEKFRFTENESEKWSVRANRRLDLLEFKTNEKGGALFIAGGDGGTLYKDIANGGLVGFEGRAGAEIDALGVIYKA